MAVAFDTATDAQEIGGDGVLSLSHSAGGSDRGIFASTGNGSGAAGQATNSITYGGVSMTEMWDIGPGTSGFNRCAGYRLAGDGNVATGSQTVTGTLASSVDEYMLSVVSMTGVDSTTPVGTPATTAPAAGLGSSSISVTVGSVGSDDLVVDMFYGGSNGDPNPTAGADQTQRTNELLGTGNRGAASTQPGTAGGVMSWTITAGEDDFGMVLGAVAFKPAAGGGATAWGPLLALQNNRLVIA